MGPGHAGMDHDGVWPRVRGPHPCSATTGGHGQSYPVSAVCNLSHTVPALLLPLFPECHHQLHHQGDKLGRAYRYRFKMCFVEMRTRAAIYQHCAQKHIPKEYVDLRFRFQEGEIAVITSGEEDRYNKDVDPRNLPLRPGILLPREYQPVDSNIPSGLEWYTPVREPSTRGAGSPLLFALPITTKRMKTDPALVCRLCRKEGCYMVCGSTLMEVALSAADAQPPGSRCRHQLTLMGLSPSRRQLRGYACWGPMTL